MTPKQLIANSGLTWVEEPVQLENHLLPYLQKIDGKMSIREPLPEEPLRPWELPAHTTEPKVALLHFSLHECAFCLPEVEYLHTFFRQKSLPGTLAPHTPPQHIAFFQIAYGTNLTAFIADEMTPYLPNEGKTHLDLEDGVAERLGVVGAPGTWLVDEKGFVIGYRNGAMNFDSPGFEALMAWLDRRGADKKSSEPQENLRESLLRSGDTPLSQRVNLLDHVVSLAILIGIGLAVCYAFMRAIRKYAGQPGKG